MLIRVAVAAVCLIWGIATPFLEKSVSAQATGTVSETQLLETLRSLRDQFAALKAEVESTTGSPSRPDRNNMDFERYRTAFGTYQSRIEDLYRQLSTGYEQIGRVYRTNPKSPLYKTLVSTYLEAKGEYDGVSALFGTIPPPEKLQTVAIISADKRLNRRIAATVKSDQPVQAVNPKDILSADESRFIGTFDAVEMFLLIKGDKACYVFFGWRDDEGNEAGKKNNSYHLSVLRSDFFPKESPGTSATAQQHLENALKLNFFALDTSGEILTDINEFLTRIKSYSRDK
jgi:hypothetical protein